MTRSFELQGHRGARGLFPENTLNGFLAALSFGIDSIELDIAVTADGVAVVAHDPRLNPDLARNAQGDWIAAPGLLIRDLRLDVIKAYDVGRIRPGSTIDLNHPAQIAEDGARVPTLAEVFETTQTSGVRIDAELKTSASEPELSVSPEEMADLVYATAHEAGALDRLAIRSFDWRGLAYLRRVHPQIPLAWLTDLDQGMHTPADVARASRGCPFQATWAPLHRTLDQAMLAEAHALGLRVVPWTVNDIEDMERLIDWGVDGICTDRPDLVRSILGRRSAS